MVEEVNRVQTSRRLLLFGVPQGFSPPEKLGKFKHTIDLILQVQQDIQKRKTVKNSNVSCFAINLQNIETDATINQNYTTV